MSLTPAQKRRKEFKTRQQWKDWALQVIRSKGGLVQVNEYAYTRGADLRKWCYVLWKEGTLSRSGKPNRRNYWLKGDTRYETSKETPHP